MSTTSLTVVRRSIAAATATVAFVALAACGAEVVPPTNDIGGAGPQEPLPTFTIEDCLDPGKQPPVTTCPYPVKSGDQFPAHTNRMQQQDEYSVPGR
ncbi:hypothetical protein J2X46_001530 [Nocardioides sp. BE266]|uniref:hypothetical protein n=1 Tax=Nocardioides sp. BE266 TaxID=2817725 RepID=UPI00285A608E|nr:hypothetical protein [Nocardioides sp. BE266]MDR7252554.1 hypothetical protein [Nocardioides sp. BE266]